MKSVLTWIMGLGFGVAGLALVALVVVGIPWLYLWSVGVLTGYYIPFTLKTWFATLVVTSIFSPSSGSTTKTK